jgi:uncharacterized protein
MGHTRRGPAMMMKRIGLVSIVVLAVSAFVQELAAGETPVATKGQTRLDNFDYRGVTLDGGRMRTQLDTVREYYLSIPNDDLLKGFRQRAGLPAPGKDLGGWYSGDVFSVFGQIVSGLARLYAATGDVACKEKADALVSEWAKCIAADGYFFFSKKPNAQHYFYDKMVGALVDDYLYCGNKEALSHLSKITDWAVKNLDRGKPAPDYREWYTLSENLYRAHLVTGDQKYSDFAAVWEYPEYWNFYARNENPFGPDAGKRWRADHAYSHVNTLGGAGAAYLARGDSRYLDVLRNAYDYLQAYQVFATGAYGPDEAFLPRDAMLARLPKTGNTAEIQCGTWAVFKMVKYLLRCTGDARYGDWAERMLLNGIGASIPMSANGHVYYYADYNPRGGHKRNHPDAWTCCTGTRPQATADYLDLIYFKDRDDLYVNLFAPSTVKWPHAGANVTLRQTTRFPDDGTVEFTVETDRPVEFGLKIRTPQWLAGPMTAKLNGEAVALESDPLHWSSLRRQWKSGDRLTVTLPMGLWASHLDPKHEYPAAILCGPVVLAARANGPAFVEKLDLKRLDRELTPVAGEALTWRLNDNPAVLLRPFYAYKEGEPYYLYLDPAAARYVTHRVATYEGTWNDSPQFHFSNVVGATAEYKFEGTGIRWEGFKFDDGGRSEVSIDGKVVAVVDQYGPGRELPFLWTSPKLKRGKHTIRLKVLEENTPPSKDRFVNIAGFEVLRDR